MGVSATGEAGELGTTSWTVDGVPRILWEDACGAGLQGPGLLGVVRVRAFPSGLRVVPVGASPPGSQAGVPGTRPEATPHTAPLAPQGRPVNPSCPPGGPEGLGLAAPSCVAFG